MTRRTFQFPWRTKNDIRADVDEELRFHLETRQQELVASGLTADAARAQTLREFGDIDDARRYLRNMDDSIESTRRRRDYLHDFTQDIRYAFRALLAAPSFTIVAILTLALGIGANTAVYSVVHGVLQQPLPFPNPEQLVKVWSANTSADILQASVSAVDLDDWRAQRRSIEDIGGWWYADGASGVDMTGLGAPQRVSTAFVSPGFFSTMRVPSAVGRLPRENEMVRGGDDRVVVLSYGYWQRNFGGAMSTINSTITLGGEPFRVVGVMPKSFAFPSPNVEMFVPFSTIPDHATPRIRPVRIMEVVARLKPNVTVEQARAEMSGITKRLSEQYAENASWGNATVTPLRDAITGSVENSLKVLLSAVSFVLLMACVNVASLLLARASSREREMAVRVSLGATRGRILRQLVTESLVLAITGGAIGTLLAVVGTRGLLALSRGQLPRSEEVSMDGSALLFALGISIAAGILFGAAPAIRSSAVNLRGSLTSGSRSATSANSRLRSMLVVVQVAFAVVLAVGAGLMVKSFGKLLDVNAGFKPDHLLAVNFTISTTRHGDTTWQRYYNDVIERVRQVPGVLSAGAAQYAPFRGMGERGPFVPPGMTLRENEEPPTVPTQRVSNGYFKTIGTPVLEGREFLPSDVRGTPLVVVVNESFARKYLSGKDAVGKQLVMGGNAPNLLMGTIIGVVADIRQSGIANEAQPLMYVSNMQSGRVKVTLVSRTQADPLTMTNSIRDAIWSLDKDQPITSVFTFDDVMNESLARPRMLTVLFGAFGILGVALGALGIYGVLAYLVSQRRREIALRIALGARTRSVMGLVLGRGLALAGGGVVIGLTLAFALSRFASSLLYGVTATDPASYGSVALLLLVIATVASALPARRASRVDPLTAMQSE